jgi:hypothetical protein
LKKTILIRCAIAAVVDGIIGLVQSLDRNIRAYKRGEITGEQLAVIVAKDTAYSAAISSAVSLPFSLVFYGLHKWAASSSTALATTAGVAAKIVGPGLVLLAMGYEVSTIELGLCDCKYLIQRHATDNFCVPFITLAVFTACRKLLRRPYINELLEDVNM